MLNNKSKLHDLIQYYNKNSDDKFFVKAILHCQFVSNYYNRPEWDNLEKFLRKFDKSNIRKEAKLQKQLSMSDSQFQYFCCGVVTVVKMFRKKLESGINHDVNTFIKENIHTSKTEANEATRVLTYKRASNQAKPGDIGTEKNNKVQVSPITASKKDVVEKNNTTNTDDIVEACINTKDFNIEFSPDRTTTTTRSLNRNRFTVDRWHYSSNHCGNSGMQSTKRLKTNQPASKPFSVPVEDPLEGKGSILRSDDLYDLDLENDGVMVADTGIAEAKTFNAFLVQDILGLFGNDGIGDLSLLKWIPNFNNVLDFNSDNYPPTEDTKRWMSGTDIENGFFENHDLRDKVNICNCCF